MATGKLAVVNLSVVKWFYRCGVVGNRCLVVLYLAIAKNKNAIVASCWTYLLL